MALLTLLIEDNPTIRDNLIPAMEDLGGAVVVGIAESEAEAALWFRQNPDGWDLAVIDLFIKEGSGLGVLAECRVRRADQKVVVLSNYATAAMRERCSRLGADAVFDKSTELESFFDFCANLGR